MRFKYYLRGIGIGILFSVFIMIISINLHKKDMISDDEIVSRAKELGMIMPDNSEDSEDIIDTEVVKDTELGFGQTITNTEIITPDGTESVIVTKNNKAEENKSNKSDKEQDFDSVTIIVKRGDVCRNIAETLFEYGLVDDAEEFRKFMGKKGYASKIHTGEYVINRGATYEEIAKILVEK